MTASQAEAGAAPPLRKEDPETLVLRGAPRPVVRFRRGLIIGITGAVAAALVTVAWLALEPPSFEAGAVEEGGEARLRGASPDALAGAPKSYGEVPKLGPPLPGDLGRPILEHQRALEDEAGAAGPGGAAPQTDPAVAAAEAERRRLAAAREAARSSAVLVELAGAGGGLGAGGPAGAPSTAGKAGAHPLRPPPSPWTLSAGTIIPASLITGLNSDLPGTVLAQVTENVRDSATGRTVLIPQGARLIGRYDSKAEFGQRRALLVWQRLLFPDGSSVELDDMRAADRTGQAGLADRVEFHEGPLLKGIALATLLGVGTELSLGGESELVEAVRESAQQNAARAGDEIVKRNLDIRPTLTVRPGWPVRAIVGKDLVLEPWRG